MANLSSFRPPRSRYQCDGELLASSKFSSLSSLVYSLIHIVNPRSRRHVHPILLTARQAKRVDKGEYFIFK